MKNQEKHSLHPLHLSSLRKETLLPDDSRQYSLHFLSLFFVTEGEMLLKSGKSETPMPKGTGVYFIKQKNLTVKPLNGKASYYFLSVQAKDTRLIALKEGVFMCTDADALIEIYRALENTLRENNRFSINTSTALYHFFIEMSQSVTTLSSDSARRSAEKKCLPALEYIKKSLTNNLELTKLASLCGYGVTHFSRLFHVATGMTTKEYIRSLRMKLAARYLNELPNMSVHELAEMLGYEYRYFLILFHRAYGISPDAYRKKVKLLPNME